jgi:hypothetical protein
VRQEQVDRVRRVIEDLERAQKAGAPQRERNRALAVLESLRRTSSATERQAGYREYAWQEQRRLEMTAKTGQSRPIKVVRGGNFEPKRVRKAKRKALIRGYLANKVADVRTEMQDRAEFFRNLRLIKLQRREIAAEMSFLAEDLRALSREVGAVEQRYPAVDLKLVDEAHDLVLDAIKSASAAASDWFAFSRQRVYYIKEL